MRRDADYDFDYDDDFLNQNEGIETLPPPTNLKYTIM